MIKSERGNVTIHGSTREVYADLACLFDAMRKSEEFEVDEVVNDALENSKKTKEERIAELCADESKIIELLKEFIADLGEEK